MSYARSLARGRVAWRSVALLGTFLLTAHAGQADIYKSVGPDGVVTFTNKRARGATVYLRSVDEKPKTQATAPSDRSLERYTRYQPFIREACALYQIPEALVRAVIKVESDFDPRAVSVANARGLMQLIPQTAERMLVSDSFDPRENILGGVRYLRILANTFNGDLALTIASYNAGEGAVLRHGGIPPFPETQDYVVRVLEYYQQYRSENQ